MSRNRGSDIKTNSQPKWRWWINNQSQRDKVVGMFNINKVNKYYTTRINVLSCIHGYNDDSSIHSKLTKQYDIIIKLDT